MPRFPYAALNPRHRLCLAQRLGMIAKWRLDGRKLLKLEARDEAPFRLVSMAGKSHLSLLRESLYSFGRHASLTPSLTIISDGSLNQSDFTAALSFWPSSIEVLTPKQVMDSIPIEVRSLLDPLVKAHALGIKLAGVIALSARGPLFFSDSDILWFSDPVAMLTHSFSQYSLAVAREEGCSINLNLAAKYAPSIMKAPSINSGCILVNKNLIKHPFLIELLIEANKNLVDEFNEQTIFGILATVIGGELPEKLCLTHFRDGFDIFNRKVWKEGYCSRHYIRFIRHQFYRDLLKNNE